jgi:endoglucanase
MKSLIAIFVFILHSVMLNAQTPALPFPQHVAYAAGTIKPSNYSQTQLDNISRAFYDQWKTVYLKDDCGVNQYYVWFDEESSNNSICVSEGQGYGMMITAYMAGYDPDAKAYFDGLYRYYKAHPSINNNNLMAWNQVIGCIDDPDGGNNSATDGDLDIAFALLLADKQWGSNGSINYLNEAISIIDAIKLHEINQNHWTPLLGDWVMPGNSEFNDSRTSDFIPDHFRAFYHTTGENNWEASVNKCYTLINDIQSNFSPVTGLLPDFIVNINSAPEPAEPYYLEGEFDGDYYYNACRAPLRITIDYLTSGDIRGKNAVQKINSWIRLKTGNNPSAIQAGYYLGGTDIPGSNYESAAFVGPLAVSAMADASNQTWLNQTNDFLLTHQLQDFEYYDNTLHLISLLVLSGNYWVPHGVPGIVDNTPELKPLMSAYPNPFSSFLTLSFSFEKNSTLSLTVFDICGKICFRKEINKTSTVCAETIDLQFLAEGIYLVMAEVDGFQAVTRILKYDD